MFELQATDGAARAGRLTTRQKLSQNFFSTAWNAITLPSAHS